MKTWLQVGDFVARYGSERYTWDQILRAIHLAEEIADHPDNMPVGIATLKRCLETVSMEELL